MLNSRWANFARYSYPAFLVHPIVCVELQGLVRRLGGEWGFEDGCAWDGWGGGELDIRVLDGAECAGVEQVLR